MPKQLRTSRRLPLGKASNAVTKRKFTVEKAAVFAAANSFETYVRALFDITGLAPLARSAAA